jgi:hypothetical protein
MSGLLDVGSIIESVGKVAGDLITTDKEKAQLEIENRKLDQAMDMAQIEVNKVEAASSSLFVAGWRPYIGWGCGTAFLYSAMFEPIARFVAQVVFDYKGAFPQLDTNLTMQVLLGMLGMAGMRSYEKSKGVATK